jgi:hypothetical protein
MLQYVHSMEIYNYYGLLKSILFPIKVHAISILWPSMDFQNFLQCITPADKEGGKGYFREP